MNDPEDGTAVTDWKSEESRDLRPKRLVVGLSGASGAIYGIRLLEVLRGLPVESHLVVSGAAEVTLAYETHYKVAEVKALADRVYGNRDMAAAISSGSFKTIGMVVAPCSVKSLAEIASGVTGSLLARAADVTLKERRRLVLMVRETPLTAGHLHAMAAVSEMGGIIAPPVPAFYAKPESLEQMVAQTVGRVLDLFDLEAPGVGRWGEGLGKTPL